VRVAMLPSPQNTSHVLKKTFNPTGDIQDIVPEGKKKGL